MPPHHPRLPLSLLSLGLALQCPSVLAEDSVMLAPLQVSDTYANDGYQARQAAVGGFQPAPLLDTPASVSVFSQQLLEDRQVRKLSEVLQSDASVGESYAPIGYYENFNVRGFELNAASSYRINGQTIAGEQNVALENKQQVELLKGLSGLQTGVSEPGGLINYVTKRAEDIRSVTVSTNEQGERYLATDLGGWFGSEKQFGLRANLAHEDIRTYVDHADGKRDFASLAFDWQINPDATLQLDAEYQHREQASVPGYQLLGGTDVPHGIDPEDRLAYQHWAKPVQNDSLNLGGRFEYRFNDTWTGTVSASRSKVVIDDYSAFAWGSSEGRFSAAMVTTTSMTSAAPTIPAVQTRRRPCSTGTSMRWGGARADCGYQCAATHTGSAPVLQRVAWDRQHPYRRPGPRAIRQTRRRQRTPARQPPVRLVRQRPHQPQRAMADRAGRP